MSGPACVVFDPTLTEYDFGPAHPMSPIRVDLTVRLARELGVLADGEGAEQTEGRLAGCWVMRIDESSEVKPDEPPRDSDESEGREKVIVRSNGVVTYVGKDIANQLWKFGLLGRDFNYRRFGRNEDGRPLWLTTSEAGERDAPSFGKAKRSYNVIDSRQMYLQALLSQALKTLGHEEEAENSIHFSYEMVALSHDTALQLGYVSDDNAGSAEKPFVEVSGRKGLGVKIDDLLDLLPGNGAARGARPIRDRGKLRHRLLRAVHGRDLCRAVAGAQPAQGGLGRVLINCCPLSAVMRTCGDAPGMSPLDPEPTSANRDHGSKTARALGRDPIRLGPAGAAQEAG